MKIPDSDQLAEVVQERLSPCVNEHTVYINTKADPPIAWVACGGEELDCMAINIDTDPIYVQAFFGHTITQHQADAWYEIAKELLAETISGP